MAFQGRYVTHFVPNGGSGLQQAASLSNIVDETESRETIRAVGCGKDSCFSEFIAQCPKL